MIMNLKSTPLHSKALGKSYNVMATTHTLIDFFKNHANGAGLSLGPRAERIYWIVIW